MLKYLLYVMILGSWSPGLIAQDSANVLSIEPRVINGISSKAKSLSAKLDRKSEKILREMWRQEQRIKSRLEKTDSLKAAEIFGNATDQYERLKNKLEGKLIDRQYIPSLDTLRTSLLYLQTKSQRLLNGKIPEVKLTASFTQINTLEEEFQKAELIKKFIKERSQFLKERLKGSGVAKELTKLNKQAYYYSAQISAYKDILSDHKKAERKAIELLSKSKPFQDFMRKNSLLASLFRMPGEDYSDPTVQASLAGLQTRSQINNLIQQQLSGGSPDAMNQFRQNVADAQSQLSQLKNKANNAGTGNSDDIMPEGFKPNNQKAKSFFKRLEYGTNVQTQRATLFFPVTSDLGLSVGYKLNDKSVVGIGASYKMGWGRGWNNISITGEGAGLRSFIDLKLKGSLWITGGYEQNFKTAIKNFGQLKDYNAWQESGLIGLSKVVSLKTKFFKKTKVQLLWDFLSNQQVPKTQMLLFRVGYNF